MEPLILYSRPGCHLCEEAAALVAAAAPAVPLEVVDIEYDLDLIQRYGDSVPVLRRPADGAELRWPFDAALLGDFVGAR